MKNFNTEDDLWLMSLALEQAEKAFRLDEVPVGAVIVDSEGKVLSEAHNEKEKHKNPVDHAEMIAIQKATKVLGDWRLEGCTLYVTLEPCLMCMGALWQSRISRVVFGAYDPKGGALSLGYCANKDKRLNHQFSIMGGVNHYQSAQLLSQFFKQKRSGYRK